MRAYAQIVPTFWTRGSGKRLRGNMQAQVLALYFMTAPSSNLIGLYYLPLTTICHETGLTALQVRESMAAITEIVRYDFDQEIAYLPECARYQVGETMSEKDKRRPAVERELSVFSGHRFANDFLARYGEAFGLRDRLRGKGLPESEDTPSEGLPENQKPPYPDPDPVPDPAQVETGSPTEDPSRPRPPDPMARSFATGSRARADVLQLFECWKRVFSREGASLDVGWTSTNADTLASRIDANGLPDCLLVCEHAPNDDMVSGRIDEKGAKHESIRYIFGNDDAFSRILRDARKARGATGKTAQQRIAEARAR